MPSFGYPTEWWLIILPIYIAVARLGTVFQRNCQLMDTARLYIINICQIGNGKSKFGWWFCIIFEFIPFLPKTEGRKYVFHNGKTQLATESGRVKIWTFATRCQHLKSL